MVKNSSDLIALKSIAHLSLTLGQALCCFTICAAPWEPLVVLISISEVVCYPISSCVSDHSIGFQIKEDNSGDGIESLINRVESLIVDGDLSTAAEALEGGLHGSEAAEIATEWVKQARKRAIAEQTLALLHACASSTTFS